MFATANPFLGGFVVRGLRSDGTRKAEKPIRKPGKQEKNYLGSGLKAWPSLGIRCSLINSLLSGIFEFARAREPNVRDCTNRRCVIDAE